MAGLLVGGFTFILLPVSGITPAHYRKVRAVCKNIPESIELLENVYMEACVHATDGVATKLFERLQEGNIVSREVLMCVHHVSNHTLGSLWNPSDLLKVYNAVSVYFREHPEEAVKHLDGCKPIVEMAMRGLSPGHL